MDESIIVKERFHVFDESTPTVCCLTVRNGFNVLGVSPEVSSDGSGRDLARQDALRRVQQFENYLEYQRQYETKPNNVVIFNFETPNFDQASEGVESLHWSGNDLVQSTDYARIGTKSLMARLNRANSKNWYRTEAALTNHADVNLGADGPVYWYGFSLYIPDPYPVLKVPVYELFWQTYTSPPDGNWETYKGSNPPLSMFLEPETDTTGNIQFAVRFNNDPYPQGHTNTVALWDKSMKYGAGNWHDFVVCVRYDSVAGLVKAWMNGVQYVDYTGGCYYRGHGGATMKMGLYTGWRSLGRDIPGETVGERTLYFDNLKVAYGPNAGYRVVDPSK